jgi:hypothetical protein
VGLGENIPISTANLNDGFAALKDGQMIMLRIPYPLSFFAKGLDGRIDDPNAGWKGRGLWSTNGDRTPWLKEGGKGSKPRAWRTERPAHTRFIGAAPSVNARILRSEVPRLQRTRIMESIV